MLSNHSIPRATVIPVLAYPNLDKAITWLCDAFGFTLRLRIVDHRAQLNVGDAAIVVTAADTPITEPSHSTMVRVEDAHAHHTRALAHGARVLDPPTDYPYGERQYSVQDFAGHRWTFSQSIADVTPESWGGISADLQ